jgi:hypothetical protein
LYTNSNNDDNNNNNNNNNSTLYSVITPRPLKQQSVSKTTNISNNKKIIVF